MVPSHIVFMDKLPITLNGKIDTKNLPEVKAQETKFTKSSSKTEKQLEKIWTKALGLEKISATSNFFEIGGDSLASIRIVSDIYSALNIKIEINFNAAWFKYSVVYSLTSASSICFFNQS